MPTHDDLVFTATDDGGASVRVGDVELVMSAPVTWPARAHVIVWGGGVRPCEIGEECPCDPEADAGDDPPETCSHEIEEPVRTTLVSADGPEGLRDALSLLLGSDAAPSHHSAMLAEADGAAEIATRAWVIDGIRHSPKPRRPAEGQCGTALPTPEPTT